MTDGILLNAIQNRNDLSQYDTVIIDEAHERSLNIDFLLGYLKQLLPKRPELKVIITSATIDPESFSKHFGDAPIIEVSGRTYPIEIRYRPVFKDSEGNSDPDDSSSASDYLDGIVKALDELSKEPEGDTLVFLSGESEIRDAQEAIQGRITSGLLDKNTELLPLYGRLSSSEQHKVFEKSKVAGVRRRVILATNVAETSLTIPNIKYVIDAGTALTMDVVNNGGEHLGGLIVPGLNLMRECFLNRTAKVNLQLSEDEQADSQPSIELLGKNTAQAVAGGALWTLAAGVERLHSQAYDLVGGPMRCIITGGDAQQLLPLLSGDWQWTPDLVLRGLQVYATA
jgi:hypothetical protein